MMVSAITIRPSGSEALDASEGDELGHVLRDPGQDRADQEHHDGELEDDLAPVEVGLIFP